jgi:hypothetical protein
VRLRHIDRQQTPANKLQWLCGQRRLANNRLKHPGAQIGPISRDFDPWILKNLKASFAPWQRTAACSAR